MEGEENEHNVIKWQEKKKNNQNKSKEIEIQKEEETKIYDVYPEIKDKKRVGEEGKSPL